MLTTLRSVFEFRFGRGLDWEESERLPRAFEERLVRGDSPRISEFLSDPSLANSSILIELIHLEFEHRLKRGEHARVEDYLSRYPSILGSRLVDGLIRAEFEFRRRGESSIDLGEYVRRFPDFDVSSLFGASRFESHAERDAKPTSNDGCPARPFVPGDRLGRYEIRSMLARGGFGTVYLAWDRELERETALKIPREAPSSIRALDRFAREARTAAALRHPHIVALLDAGVLDRIRYISSEFVDGDSLADRLDRGALSPEESARIASELASALDYMHSMGVVHRDVKPSNILIDRAGAVRLTDFGLAKRLDLESSLTLSGDFLGTPAYMSPEQLSGDASAADERSDIHAIGIVLDECLTGRRPFAGGRDALARQILEARPRRPREITPGVPRDIEVICLKCLEKEPSARYSDARALGDDLRRFLAREPIAARPATVLESLVRWARRKPGAASLAAGVVVVVIAATVISSTFYLEARRGLLETTAQKQLVDAHRRVVLTAFEKMSEIAANDLNVVPGAWPARKRLIEVGIEAQERLIALGSDAPDLEDARIRSLRELGFLQVEVGRWSDAIRTLQEVERRLDRARRSAGAGDREARLDRGWVSSRLAIALRESRRFEESASAFRRAIELLGRLRDEHPRDSKIADRYVAALYGEAILLRRIGKGDASERSFLAAVKLADELRRESPGDWKRAGRLSNIESNYASLLLDLKRFEESIVRGRRALELIRSASEEDRRRPVLREGEARARHVIGCATERAGRREAAVVELRSAREIARKLFDEAPENQECESVLAWISLDLGLVSNRLGLRDESMALIGEARDRFSRLLKREPNHPAFLSGLDECRIGLDRVRGGSTPEANRVTAK